VFIVATVFLCQTAFAQPAAIPIVELTYWGETPDTGYASYQPASGSYDNQLWDYVYTISPTTDFDGPFYFAVYCAYEPDTIWDDDGAWTGQWYASMPMRSGPLVGQPGVYWLWDASPSSKPAEGLFHFSSRWAPTQGQWSARGIEGTAYNGDGTTWTAVPEPASMAVTGLCLFGVAAWKRRKGLLNDKDA
jgi:hypothetical protein